MHLKNGQKELGWGLYALIWGRAGACAACPWNQTLNREWLRCPREFVPGVVVPQGFVCLRLQAWIRVKN